MELGTRQFLEGEQAYKRLAQAKSLDSLVNLGSSALQNRLELDPTMHAQYLRDIVESGGAPSLQELTAQVEALGGVGLVEEGLVKSLLNKAVAFWNSSTVTQSVT